jgi:hypothetical protein
MHNKLMKSLLGAVIAVFFVSALTFAKSAHINILYRGELGSSVTLLPGNYKMVVNPLATTPSVAFYQNGKLVGTARVRVVTEARKNSQTEVFYSAPRNKLRGITQIDVSGWKDKLVFKKSS